MENALVHEIELYSFESFRTLMDHEVNRSRRYGDSLTLIDFLVETDPVTPEAQHSAEVFAINALNLYLRNTDIPCKKSNEFLILMPSTSAPGARTACERLRKLMTVEHQQFDRVSFTLSTYIGIATMPIDHSTSSDELANNASQALLHARTHRMANVVAFSELET
jgi:predicted signal transduction protein with EAL and GGDEF domain